MHVYEPNIQVYIYIYMYMREGIGKHKIAARQTPVFESGERSKFVSAAVTSKLPVARSNHPSAVEVPTRLFEWNHPAEA